MAIQYKGQLNLGNEALGSEKTITANEFLRTAESKDLAREIHHRNTLIPEQVAQAVLDNLCAASADLLNMGFAVQLKSGDDVALRLIPDIHVAGGNINLKRARELDPTVTELTADNAGQLIDKAGGVTVRVRAIAQPKFTELLLKGDTRTECVGIDVKDYVAKKQSDGQTDGSSDNQDGDDDPNSMEP